MHEGTDSTANRTPDVAQAEADAVAIARVERDEATLTRAARQIGHVAIGGIPDVASGQARMACSCRLWASHPGTYMATIDEWREHAARAVIAASRTLAAAIEHAEAVIAEAEAQHRAAQP